MKRISKVLVAASLAGCGMKAAAQMNPKEKMMAALKAIQEKYVDSMTDERLTNAAIAGMVQELDPHSRYFSREQAQQMQEAMSGSFSGVGLQYIIENDSLIVTQVIPDGPASKAGLKISDKIVAIDGNRFTGGAISGNEVSKKLRGAKGSTVSVDVVRKQTTPFTVTITRDNIADKSVRAAYMVDDKVGYIALGIFNKTTRPEMDSALLQLKAAGMQSLVLDLQGNGGGLVQAAVGVADEFLKMDQLVFYGVPQDKGHDYYYTAGTGKFPEGRLVVLIDQNTASASEILSGALQDWDRAVLVGRRSFGKGLMQKPVPLPDGSVLELSGSRYYTPSNRSIQKPYHGAQYTDNVASRMASGELTDASVIHFPDSLKYTTLVGKRTVYGGGGIMPDKYVPIDSIDYDPWMQQVAYSGLIKETVFNYLDSDRPALKATYPTFAFFEKSYQTPEKLVDEIVANAAAQGLQMPANRSSKLRAALRLDMKALLAGQLFGGNDYYLRVANTGSETFRSALQIIRNPEVYNRYLSTSTKPSKK